VIGLLELIQLLSEEVKSYMITKIGLDFYARQDTEALKFVFDYCNIHNSLRWLANSAFKMSFYVTQCQSHQ